jgi:hypothetical protein
MAPLEIRIPTDPGALAQLRQAVRAWLESLEIVEQDVAAVVAASSEVAADAVESLAGEGTPVALAGVLDGGDVVVRFAGPPAWRIEDHPSRYVAALLVDDVTIERTDDAVAVVLRKAASRGLRH